MLRFLTPCLQCPSRARPRAGLTPLPFFQCNRDQFLRKLLFFLLALLVLQYVVGMSLYRRYPAAATPASPYVVTDVGRLTPGQGQQGRPETLGGGRGLPALLAAQGGRLSRLLGWGAREKEPLPLCPERPRNLGR